MIRPNIKYIFLILFFVALIPLVITLYNKQRELADSITPHDEYIAQFNTTQEKDIYEEYMSSVLGAYDEREPRDEELETILGKVEDIVEEFDSSKLEKITPEVRLPTIDSSKDFDIGNGESVTVRERSRDAELLFNGKKVDRILKGETLSLHMYNDNKLTYPTIIVGSSVSPDNVERKVVYCLVNGKLVRYDTVHSLVDLELYIDEVTKEEKIVVYSRDRNIQGNLVTVWSINHDSRSLDRDYMVLEIR